MFSVVLQAYFSTRSSRSLEAGTWPQFSTPLSPVPVPNRRWLRAGCASSRSTSVCPFQQDKEGLHQDSGVGKCAATFESWF